jgi:hypothetical protein
MLRIPRAFISLTLLCTLGRGSEAQVLERVRSSATTTTAVTLDPERKLTLVQPLAGPTNLTASGTPAIARLRWDTLPGVIGYHVSRTDPTGVTVKLTTDAITANTFFEDQSGGVKPGLAYTYHVTAAYPNDGFGTAEVSFTPPAPAVPAWVRVVTQSGQNALAWASVPDAGSYQIIEGWMVPIYQTAYTPVYSANGTTSWTTTTVQSGYQYMNRNYIVAAPQSSLPVSTDQAGHRFQVGAVYPPSGVTAPTAQWPSIVAP